MIINVENNIETVIFFLDSLINRKKCMYIYTLIFILFNIINVFTEV